MGERGGWHAAKDLRSGFEPGSAAYVACALTTRPPARRCGSNFKLIMNLYYKVVEMDNIWCRTDAVGINAIDCIEEMDVTTWHHPLVCGLLLGSQWFLIWAAPSWKFQVHAGKNKYTDSTYMGMRRGHGRSGEVAMVTRAGFRGHWSINLSIRT